MAGRVRVSLGGSGSVLFLGCNGGGLKNFLLRGLEISVKGALVLRLGGL